MKSVPTPSASDEDADEALPDFKEDTEEVEVPQKRKGKGAKAPRRQSARAKKISYAETDGEEM